MCAATPRHSSAIAKLAILEDRSEDWIDEISRLSLSVPSSPAREPIGGAFLMPYRPNYRIERAERDRVKKAKKEEKIRQQQERAALRKAENAEDTRPDEPENP